MQTSEALAAVLRAQGEYSISRCLLHETLAGYVVGPEDKALLLNMLADSMREQGKSDAARAIFGDVSADQLTGFFGPHLCSMR